MYVLFLFMFVNNLMGMVFYSFVLMSYFVLIFLLSFMMVLGVIMLGFSKYGL